EVVQIWIGFFYYFNEGGGLSAVFLQMIQLLVIAKGMVGTPGTKCLSQRLASVKLSADGKMGDSPKLVTHRQSGVRRSSVPFPGRGGVAFHDLTIMPSDMRRFGRSSFDSPLGFSSFWGKLDGIQIWTARG
ncbi:MAG: hypothetical protein JZU50_04545, partial [Desulfobulbaceae bacterium]|nr:hypothetical protein [Desulfobulbaceae bacterium]